jgi:hypothetical protein
MIYVPSFSSYSSSQYPSVSQQAYESNYILRVSAACDNYINVTATMNCPASTDLLADSFVSNSTNCSAVYNDGCELPVNVAIADLSVCLVLITAILVVIYIERRLSEKLDINIQTPSDYTLQVLDPPSDATDPHEWYNFFSRYGDVKMITVVKDTHKLTELLMTKVKLARACALRLSGEQRLDIRCTTDSTLHDKASNAGAEEDAELVDAIDKANNSTVKGQATTALNNLPATQIIYYKPLTFYEHLLQSWLGISLNRHCMLAKLADIEKELFEQVYRSTSPVTRVFCVFEREEHKTLAHSALEVPDLYALMDLKIGRYY